MKWDSQSTGCMELIDVRPGTFLLRCWEKGVCRASWGSPCIYRHLEKQLRVWVHGDDFVPLGYIVNVRCFFAKLQEVWVVTNRGILVSPVYHDCVQSIRVLGRIVERSADGITWEAVPRHAELISKSFGVTGRSVATRGVRDKLTDSEGEFPIDKEASDRYRANTMHAQYLSSDRPDTQIECCDLAQDATAFKPG